MNKIIATLTISLLSAIALSGARAENPTPFKLPAAHTEAIESAALIQNNELDAVRDFSPFANLNESDMESVDNTQLINDLKEFASKYLGTRYRRGSAGPKSFDCSGFVGFIFKKFGFNLSRSSSSQYNEGKKVEKDDLRPGDLMFFSGRAGGKGRVGHVAMVVDVNPDGSCTFIHASTSKGVTYQKFPDGGYYSKRYMGAKRIIPSEPEA